MSEPQRFSYHRAVAPMLWVFVAVASVELLVVHLLVSLLWSRTTALVLSGLTLASVAWLIAAIRSMERLPVLLDEDRLLMRAGTIKQASVPLSSIAGLRQNWDAAALKERGVLRLSLLAYPNILLDLRESLPGRRLIRAIAHRLDDPAAFARAIQTLGADG